MDDNTIMSSSNNRSDTILGVFQSQLSVYFSSSMQTIRLTIETKYKTEQMILKELTPNFCPSTFFGFTLLNLSERGLNLIMLVYRFNIP